MKIPLKNALFLICSLVLVNPIIVNAQSIEIGDSNIDPDAPIGPIGGEDSDPDENPAPPPGQDDDTSGWEAGSDDPTGWETGSDDPMQSVGIEETNLISGGNGLINLTESTSSSINGINYSVDILNEISDLQIFSFAISTDTEISDTSILSTTRADWEGLQVSASEWDLGIDLFLSGISSDLNRSYINTSDLDEFAFYFSDDLFANIFSISSLVEVSPPLLDNSDTGSWSSPSGSPDIIGGELIESVWNTGSEDPTAILGNPITVDSDELLEFSFSNSLAASHFIAFNSTGNILDQSFTVPSGLHDPGVVSGNGGVFNSGGGVTNQVNSVPEPLILFLFGVGLIGFFSRRKKI